MWRLGLVLFLNLLAFRGFEVRGEELIVCGWDEVYVLETDGESARKIWRWRAQDRTELPESFRDLFETTDECKPVEEGHGVLISSSSGGLALVERPSGQVSWYGYVGNAHSIELLPAGRVAVAGSTHEDGNRLVIFDLQTPDNPLCAEELYSGHGVIWDADREILWALGFRILNSYCLMHWQTPKPRLHRIGSYELPEPGGHDLYPLAGTPNLIVTTDRQVFLFDRDRREFSLHPELKGKQRVKGVAVHPRTGRVAYVQAEGENWWASRIHFLNPAGSLPQPEEKIYKARWTSR